MDQLLQRLHWEDVGYLAPELTLVISTVLLVILDLAMPQQVTRRLLGWLTLLGIAVAMVFVCVSLNHGEFLELLNQSYRVDSFASIFKLLLLGGTGLIVLMSIGSIHEDDIPHIGEYYYLLLPAVLGGMIMASSGDLITLFVGMELLGITSYIMVGMRKRNKQSNEAAFKYFVLGAISSATILYGMSFLYGMTGTTNIALIGMELSANLSDFNALVYVSFFLMLAGFGFKISAAPFHTWAPDVYQGAPTPITAFLAVVSKAAGFAILFRIVYSIFLGLGLGSTTPIHDAVFIGLLVLAAISMVFGNAMALRQYNMKRLLAYSGIANAGYLLIPLGTQINYFHTSNFDEMIFYLLAYLLMNIGAFAVIMIVSKAAGHDEMSGFAGLYYRAPLTAVAMVVLLLSLAGIPITAGFFGKLYIMVGALQMRAFWIAAIMIGTSVISYYYYFSVARQMFMRSTTEAKEIKIVAPLGIALWLCVGGTLLLGFFPQLVLRYLEEVVHWMDIFIRML